MSLSKQVQGGPANRKGSRFLRGFALGNAARNAVPTLLNKPSQQRAYGDASAARYLTSLWLGDLLSGGWPVD